MFNTLPTKFIALLIHLLSWGIIILTLLITNYSNIIWVTEITDWTILLIYYSHYRYKILVFIICITYLFTVFVTYPFTGLITYSFTILITYLFIIFISNSFFVFITYSLTPSFVLIHFLSPLYVNSITWLNINSLSFFRY